MALINWHKKSQVTPESAKKKNKRQSGRGEQHQRSAGAGASGQGGLSSPPVTPKPSKDEPETPTRLKSLGTKSLGKFFRRMSFLDASENVLRAVEKGDAEEDFYRERDVTEIVDPKYSERWYVILPDGNFRKSWDMIQALALFYLALLVPIRVGYDINAHGTPYTIDFSLEVYFIIDFVLNFITAYENSEDHGRIITMPSMIASNYAKTWMVVDFLGLLPIDLALRISQGRFVCSFNNDGCSEEDEANSSAQLLKLFKLLRLFRLIKLLRLVRIAQLVERYQDDLFRLLPTLSILKLLGMLLFIGHFFGCFFFFFSTENFGSSLEADSNSWVVKEFGEDYPDKSLASKYIASMYWAFTTMTTVGYGDISAKTRGERVFAILGMIAGAFVYSGVIGSIGSVIQNLDLSSQAHRMKMDAVSTYVRERALPKELRKEMLLFFRVQKVSAYNESELLGEVPMDLRSAIIHYVYGRQIGKCSLLRNCSKHFLTEMFARMVPQTYIRGTIIYRKGEFASNLYIIIKGKVEMLDHHTSLSIITFPEGSYFGEKILIPPFRHDETMRARTTCKLLSISKDELDFILEQYEYDKNVMHERALKRNQKVKKEFDKYVAESNDKKLQETQKVTKRTVVRAAMSFKRKSVSLQRDSVDLSDLELPQLPPQVAPEPSTSREASEEKDDLASNPEPKPSTSSIQYSDIASKLDQLTRAVDDLRIAMQQQKPS